MTDSSAAGVTSAGHPGLRFRLVMLVIAAVTPFLLLIGFVARQHRVNERAEAEGKALYAARAMASSLDSRTGAMEMLAQMLVHATSPRPADSLINDATLRRIARGLPGEFGFLGTFTPDNVNIGSSRAGADGRRIPLPVPIVQGDSGATDRFVFALPQSLAGPEATPVVALVERDSATGIRVAVFLPLADIGKSVLSSRLPPGAFSLLARRDGVVIAGSSTARAWIGRRLPSGRETAADSGTTSLKSPDGSSYLAAYVKTRHAPWTVYVGIPAAVAFADARRDFWRAVGWGALALLLGVALAWTQATRIIGPLRAVIADARVLGRGELGHRSTAQGPAEVGALAVSLNSMAERLQKREDDLRESEQRFRAVIENATDMVAIIGLDGKRRYASPSMARTLGYQADELLNTSWLEIIHPDDVPAATEFFRTISQSWGTTSTIVLRYQEKVGGWRTFSVVGQNMRDVEGVRGIVYNLRDITRQMRLESELSQTQKMESIGQLAGGIAHDFNNLLTVIRGRVEFLAESDRLDDSEKEDVSEIRKAAERAASLTGQLLAFSRKQLLKPRVLNLNSVLDEVTPIITRLIGEDLHVAIEHGDNLGNIVADPTQVEQVILNLSVNARDAMPHGGILRLRTANTEVAEEVTSSADLPPAGEYVMLEVCDSGSGMDAATRLRIFDPFFTTKEAGKGTGLGLATVYGIVKQSGGNITVESLAGKGSTFRVFFPRSRDVVQTSVARTSTASSGGTETILLVEDEQSVRELATRILEERGYKVIPAQHGGDALQILSGTDIHIDLILSDVVMPGMSGREVVEAIRQLGRNPRVIYMSGYTDDEIVRRGLMDPANAFVSKPFTPDVLAAYVRDALDAV